MKHKRSQSPAKPKISQKKYFSFEKYKKKQNSQSIQLPNLPFSVRLKTRQFAFNKDKLNLDSVFQKKQSLLNLQSERRPRPTPKLTLARHLHSNRHACLTQQQIRRPSQRKHHSSRRKENQPTAKLSPKHDFFSKLRFPKKSQKLKIICSKLFGERPKTFKAKYKILRLLGNGSNSSVYLGRSRQSRRLFAIKVVNKAKLERQSELANLNVGSERA